MTENDVRELFASIKWGNMFCCTKCGHDKFTKGNKYQDRRCQACRTNESLYKNTALEGLRFELLKFYKALEMIYNTNHFYYSDDIIFYDKAYISIDTFINQYSHLFPGNEKFNQDKIIQSAIDKRKISLRKIAEELKIEQNSLSLRLRKVADRIPEITLRKEVYYDKIRSFISIMDVESDSHVFEFEHLLKLALFPTKGKWSNGELSYKEHKFSFEDEPSLNFIMYSNDWNDAFADEVDNLGDITYASESWRYIFIG